MPKSASHKNYRIGSMYSVVTAFLLATQEPFSALAAKRLSPMNFVCVTQCALLLSIPLLILPAASRRDFFALIFDFSNLAKLSLLFLIGLCGLLLYDLGLSNAHPIIIAAILNLSPFWAALIGLLISKKPIPVSPVIFFGCLAVAFIGAMTIAWSQTDNSNRLSISDLANNILHSSWVYAIPIPIFFALSGTLIGQWFKKFDDSAAIAANFMISALLLIPATLLISYVRQGSFINDQQEPAIILLMVGTLVAAAAGRVLYQVALTVTKNDNGFVTMFFLLVPALTCLISIPLSWRIAELRFIAGPMFFSGLLAVAAPLVFFSMRSWR